MIRRCLAGIVGVLALAACAHPTGSLSQAKPTARLVMPAGTLEGAPFTASTPFTNSLPLVSPLALALVPPTTQVVEAVDPRNGAIVARLTVQPGEPFVLPALPPAPLIIWQAILRDAAGGLHGCLATAWIPGAGGEHLLSPGSTIAPLAAALASAPDPIPQMGRGFAGSARGTELRMLLHVSEAANQKAIAHYDPVLVGAPDGASLMAAIGQQATQVAAAIASSSATPEAMGVRLGEVLGTPLATVSPTPRPTPSVPWIGRGPAIPDLTPQYR